MRRLFPGTFGRREPPAAVRRSLRSVEPVWCALDDQPATASFCSVWQSGGASPARPATVQVTSAT